MKRYGMAVDTRRCVGCSACTIACKTENNLPEGGFRSWVVQEVTGRFPHLDMQIRSERCNQCEDAPCVKACPTGASYIGEGGVVLIDKAKCTGCKACISACPYEARYVHPEGHVDKCTFCMHRVQKGLQPACAENCPTKALTFGDLNDPRSEISTLLSSRRHDVNKPELGTRPKVFFLE